VAETSAIASQKGGTGKTAVTAAFAPLLAVAGERTLLVDMDEQGNLTDYYGGVSDDDATLVDVLLPGGDTTAEEVLVRDVHGIPGLDLLPSDPRASGLKLQLVNEDFREFKLRAALEPLLGHYDRVLIDCPPDLGLLTINALCVADRVFAPVAISDRNALQGAQRIGESIAKLHKQGMPVVLHALFPVEVERTKTARRNLRALAAAGLPVTEAALPRRTPWNDALERGFPVTLYAPSDVASLEVITLARELWPELADRIPWASDLRKHLPEPLRAAVRDAKRQAKLEDMEEASVGTAA
jgi:chromosome partitioning protein